MFHIHLYADTCQLEYIYENPKFRTTCIFGVIFVILGNLTGNAIAFGQYFMQAAGNPDHPEAIRGLAVAVLTVACLIHGLWREAGVVINNILALIKVLILMAVIVIGFAAAGGASFGNGPVGKEAVKVNFNVRNSFSGPSNDVGSYARSIIFAVYPYSGFEQPFYVSRLPTASAQSLG